MNRGRLSRTNQVFTISAIAGMSHVLLIVALFAMMPFWERQVHHARAVQVVGTVGLLLVVIGYLLAMLRSFAGPCHWLGRVAPAVATGLLSLSTLALLAYSRTHQQPYVMADFMSYGFLLPGPLVLLCGGAWLILRQSASTSNGALHAPVAGIGRR